MRKYSKWNLHASVLLRDWNSWNTYIKQTYVVHASIHSIILHNFPLFAALIDAEWAIKGKTGPEITAADVEDPPKDGVEEVTATDS